MRYLVFSFILITVFSCKKEESIPSDSPTLSFVSIEPTEVVELQDEMTLKINYNDPNGDLGDNDPNVKNLFVEDMRNNVVHSYRVQELAPQGSDIEIIGSLTVTIDPLVITDGSSSETGQFYIYMTDRAGNRSEGVLSDEFTVSVAE